MSWESSLEYYRIINEVVRDNLGWLHSAKSILYSVDFEEIEVLQHDWKRDELTQIMIDAWKKLEKAGADTIVICTNTMHKMADDMQAAIALPIIHIADATAMEIKKQWLKKIGLLGTKFTMEEDFYKGRLIEKHWLDVIVPNEDDRQVVHDIIYNELCLGEINETSKNKYVDIINRLIEEWAEWVILWCTEIPLLIKKDDVTIPVLDTTYIHAEQAVIQSLT